MKILVVLMGMFFAFDSSATDLRELNEEQLFSAEIKYEAKKLIETMSYLKVAARDLDNATSDYFSHEFKVFEATGSFEEVVWAFTKTLPEQLNTLISQKSSTQMTRKDFYLAFATPAERWSRTTMSVLKNAYLNIKNQPGQEEGITSTFQIQYVTFNASPACVGWLLGKTRRNQTLLFAAYNCYND